MDADRLAIGEGDRFDPEVMHFAVGEGITQRHGARYGAADRIGLHRADQIIAAPQPDDIRPRYVFLDDVVAVAVAIDIGVVAVPAADEVVARAGFDRRALPGQLDEVVAGRPAGTAA